MNSKVVHKKRIELILISFLTFTVFVTKDIAIAGINFQLSEITVMSIICILYVKTMINHKITINNKNVFVKILMLLLIIIFIISTINAYNSFISFKGVIKWLLGFLVFFIIINNIKNEDDFFWTYNNFIFFGNCIIIIGFVVAIFSGKVNGQRMELLGFSSNQIGQVLGILIILNFTQYLMNKKKINILALIINAFVLILSFSKANWAITIGSILFIFLIYIIKYDTFYKKIIKFIIGFFIFIIIGLIGLKIFEIFLPDRIQHLINAVSDPTQYKTMELRFDLWRIAYQLGNENFWGIGLYNTQFFLPVNHAHNIFLEIYASTGILGISTFSLLMLNLFIKMKRALRYFDNLYMCKLGLSMSALSYFISNNFSDSFGARTHMFFWICCGLLLSSGNFTKKGEVNLV